MANMRVDHNRQDADHGDLKEQGRIGNIGAPGTPQGENVLAEQAEQDRGSQSNQEHGPQGALLRGDVLRRQPLLGRPLPRRPVDRREKTREIPWVGKNKNGILRVTILNCSYQDKLKRWCEVENSHYFTTCMKRFFFGT